MDVSGVAFSRMLKANRQQADSAAAIVKTTAGGAITVVGTYTSARSTNTQRVRASVTDSDTDALAQGVYVHELKRLTPERRRSSHASLPLVVTR